MFVSTNIESGLLYYLVAGWWVSEAVLVGLGWFVWCAAKKHIFWKGYMRWSLSRCNVKWEPQQSFLSFKIFIFRSSVKLKPWPGTEARKRHALKLSLEEVASLTLDPEFSE